MTDKPIRQWFGFPYSQSHKLILGTSPHIHSQDLTSKVMWSVFLALIPSGITSMFIFGMPAFKIMAISILSCVVSEALIQKLRHKKITLSDGSAWLTGLLLAYNLSSGVPFWIPLLGGIFAMAIAKHSFGGLGANIFNPALAARAFLIASWPKHMTNFVKPFSPDAITSATPLMMFKEGKVQHLAEIGLSYADLFLGRRPGCLGEVSILALLLGAGYLLWKKYISWQTPAGFIMTVGLLSWIFGRQGLFTPLEISSVQSGIARFLTGFKGDFIFSILSGGLILGAFFMATDYVTSPITRKGQLIFGIGCGIITFIIRRFGGYPEGVSYSILMMNAVVPLIDRYIRPRIYGRV